MNSRAVDVCLVKMMSLIKDGKSDEAIILLRMAVNQGNVAPDILGNLGALLFSKGKSDEGMAYLDQAMADPNVSIDHLINYGYCLKQVGMLDVALRYFDFGVIKAPENARLRWHRALLRLLLKRDLDVALDDYEYRWKVSDFPEVARDLSNQLWDGSFDRRVKLFVYAEQGFGDTIQFVRYISLAARRVGRIVFEVQQELYLLINYQRQIGFSVVPPNVDVIARGTVIPAVDAQIALMSLPRALLAYDFANPPCRSAYLAAPTGLSVERNEEGIPTLVVGLAWCGRPSHPKDKIRSYTLEDCQPLFEVAGISLVSLQVGAATSVLKARPDLPVLEISSRLGNFFDTAQIIRGLDLVIAPDTAVAHLAAAMGVPTWMPINPIPDWRWGLDLPRSSWYDAVTLFRQAKVGDWSPVFKEMGEQLSKWAWREL